MNAGTERGNPHASAMDRMYHMQRHIYDATRRYYLLGRDELLDGLLPPSGGSVLEIGCGTGRNLIGVAKRYPHVELFGIDISREMLKSARASAARHNLQGKIKFACTDATNFDALSLLGRQKFDRIYFSYTLSMIPAWQQALQHASMLLAPGGELHVADFGQCVDLPPIFRAVLFRWLGAFHVMPRSGLQKEIEAIARQSDGHATFASRFRGYAWLGRLQHQPAAHHTQHVRIIAKNQDFR
jgi:S-adenosylmethionine-diacylgycerolhomoserine-N-methlytransferase